jgi:hypothetical protein
MTATVFPDWLPTAGGIIGILCSGLLWFARRDLDRIERDSQRTANRCESIAEALGGTEKDLLRLQADLARDYVHRDHFVERMALIDSRLEKIWQTLCELSDAPRRRE